MSARDHPHVVVADEASEASVSGNGLLAGHSRRASASNGGGLLAGSSRRNSTASAIDPLDQDEASSDEEDWGHQGPHHIPHHLRRPSASHTAQDRQGLLAGSGAPHGDSASGDGGDGGVPHGHVDLHAPGGSTAKSMLFVFTVCNLLTYFDRGSIGVCLSVLSKDEPDGYGLSNFEGGVLAGAYMFGYISASPVFAMAVRKYDPFRVIAFGLFVWAVAALGCAGSIGFVSLLFARAVSGIGEAAFLCIAPPFIDKCAPSAAKSRWMAIFYCAIPVGYAMGFVVSGHWLNFYLVPAYYQWRFIFLFEAVCMVPFILWCLATDTPPHNFKDPPPSKQHRLDELNEPVSYRAPTPNAAQRAAAANAANDGGTFADYMETVMEVLSNRVYILITLGFAAQTFVLGSVAYFGVRYLMENFGFSVGQAGSYFGGITVVVGVLGSLFGGWLCDYMRAGKNKAHATATTMRLAFILITIAFPLCLASFLKNTPEWFFSIFVVAEFVLFATASPINSAVIWCVPFRLTPLACSLSIMFIHILGDAISPAIIGAILDATQQNWTLTMTMNTCWLGWSVIFWAWAWKAAEAHAKAIDEEMIKRGMAVDGEGSDEHPPPLEDPFATPSFGPTLRVADSAIDHDRLDITVQPPSASSEPAVSSPSRANSPPPADKSKAL